MMPAVMEANGLIDTLPAISLTALQGEAAFLTRSDRKYLVPASAVGALLTRIDRSTRVLEIDGRRYFGYTTPYFDDDLLTSYSGAACGRPNRFKVRTRLYIDSGLCHLEVKVRDGRGRTIKHRIDHEAALLKQLTNSDRAWLRTFPQIGSHADWLHHCITTRYQRVTLVLPDAAGRVTVDSDLVFALPDGRESAVPAYTVIETKGAGRPTTLDRVLWRSGYRPVSFSKFAVGVSLLVPGLAANRWHRLRQRVVDVAGPLQPLRNDASPVFGPERCECLPHRGC